MFLQEQLVVNIPELNPTPRAKESLAGEKNHLHNSTKASYLEEHFTKCILVELFQNRLNIPVAHYEVQFKERSELLSFINFLKFHLVVGGESTQAHNTGKKTFDQRFKIEPPRRVIRYPSCFILFSRLGLHQSSICCILSWHHPSLRWALPS